MKNVGYSWHRDEGWDLSQTMSSSKARKMLHEVQRLTGSRSANSIPPFSNEATKSPKGKRTAEVAMAELDPEPRSFESQ